MHGRIRTVLALPALALALAACGGGGPSGNAAVPGGPAESAAAGSTGPSPTPDTPDDQVLTAYRTYWDAVIAANRSANPSAAGLAKVAANPELTRVRDTISRNKIQQLSLRGEVGHEPKPAVITGATATLEDCYDISQWNPVNLKTGKPVEVTEAGGTGRYRARWTLRRSGATWLVVDTKALGGC